MKESHKTDEQRFWEKVDKSAGPAGCWLWTGFKNTLGYGQMSINSKPVLMHRYSWILVVGSIAEGMCILHRCDTRNCVNPHHLFLGDHYANMQDRMQKGNYKSIHGENSILAKLTETEVRDILNKYSDGWTLREIANLYTVTHTAVSKIVLNKTWKHIPRPPKIRIVRM